MSWKPTGRPRGRPPKVPKPPPSVAAATMTDEELEAELRARLQLRAYAEARAHLIPFVKLTIPDMTRPDDPLATTYQDDEFHHAVARELEWLEATPGARLIIEAPPRHGKSELTSRRFIPWVVGRNPHWQIIFATYGAEFSEEFGRHWRDLMNSAAYQTIFPEAQLRKDTQSVAELRTTKGGAMLALGVGGAATGRGADLLAIDDPIKDQKEADSEVIREARWKWFTAAAFTRLMPGGRVLIVLTRWHDDDIVGRIFNEEYVPREESSKWRAVKFPAITPSGAALCPKRYPLEQLNSIKGMVGRRVWSALYMQNPSPDEGLFFKKDMFQWYDRPKDLPDNLRFYAASDHALTEKQENDATVLIPFALDEKDHIWILPDLQHGRWLADETLERMIALMKRRKPLFWYAEDEHINKALGPFRRKRMFEEKVYTSVVSIKPLKDLRSRAAGIHGRMSMGMVHFPSFASWAGALEAELLKFPTAKHDDYVAAMAMIGLGLDSQAKAAPGRKPQAAPQQFPTGTIQWIREQTRRRERETKLQEAMAHD